MKIQSKESYFYSTDELCTIQEKYNTYLHMHKKSELEAMSQEELIDIAKNLGIPSPNEGDRMGLIYQIIDEESILSASQKATTTKTPRKRVK